MAGCEGEEGLFDGGEAVDGQLAVVAVDPAREERGGRVVGQQVRELVVGPHGGRGGAAGLAGLRLKIHTCCY